MCTYENGDVWIAERKTAHDLASSIKDPRQQKQTC